MFFQKSFKKLYFVISDLQNNPPPFEGVAICGLGHKKSFRRGLLLES